MSQARLLPLRYLASRMPGALLPQPPALSSCRFQEAAYPFDQAKIFAFAGVMFQQINRVNIFERLIVLLCFYHSLPFEPDSEPAWQTAWHSTVAERQLKSTPLRYKRPFEHRQ